MISAAEKKRLYDNFLKSHKKKYGEDSIIDPSEDRHFSFISTGSTLIDDAVGIGGLPRGRIVEVYGPESSGKTTLATTTMIEAQRLDPDKMVLFIDVEHAFNIEYAEKLGLNVSPDSFSIIQPSSGEEALDAMYNALSSGIFSMIVLDSVGGLMTKRQLEKGIGEDTMAEVARILSQSMPKIAKLAKKTGTLCFFINQQRSSLAMYGPSTVTMGGKSLKYFASVRISIKKASGADAVIEKGGRPIGQGIVVKCEKNKVSTPFLSAETKIFFGEGFDSFFETVTVAISKGLIRQGGAWFTVNEGAENEQRLQGKNSVIEYYAENVEEFDELREKMFGTSNEYVAPEEGEDDEEMPEDLTFEE